MRQDLGEKWEQLDDPAQMESGDRLEGLERLVKEGRMDGWEETGQREQEECKD